MSLEREEAARLNNPEACMSLSDHLTELRQRILWSLAAWALGTAISSLFIDNIIAVLTAPVQNLYYMRPAEAFFIYIKVALAFGLFLAAPLVLYQLWAFLKPALLCNEKHFLQIVVPVSLLLFWGGLLFADSFVFPQALSFFTTFAEGKIAPLLSIESYLEFYLMLVLPFGVIFNLPMVLVLLAQLGLINAGMLAVGRKYMILGAFVFAGIITPTPDIVTQTLLAGPMIVLYEISRLVIMWREQK